MKLLLLLSLTCASFVATAQQEIPLSNADVLKMIQAGLASEIIVQKIAVSSSNFDLNIDNLIQFKKNGVSDEIVKAMLSKQATPISVSATSAQKQDEFSRLRDYLGVPQNYKISRANSAKLPTKFPLRLHVHAGNDIHVVDTIRELSSRWSDAWAPLGRSLHVVSQWQDADIVISHYAATEDLRRVSESRGQIQTDVRVVGGTVTDYGAMYAGIARRDPWLAIAGMIPKPVETLVPEVRGETVTESFDVLPVLVYVLRRTGPQSFELLGKHAYITKNGRTLGRPLWDLIRDSLPVPGGVFINAKNQVIVRDASAFPQLEEFSGRLFMPFVINGGQPQAEVGRYWISYTATGLKISDSHGTVVYEGYGSEAEYTFLDRDKGANSYLVVMFHQPARKLEKATIGGYISAPRLLGIR